ncbi:sensor histidine kinase [Nocardioides sp.]|uniref:sensor histidine kinase n=1 Tax=Nocardioides sp. TaxID=35761 RepID=UPI003519C43C
MRPRSLVVRLALAAGVLAGLSTAVGVIVVEHSATQRLVSELDADLATQRREWQALADRHPAATPAELDRLGHEWLAEQHEHPLTQVQLVRVKGEPVLSNQPDLAARACAAALRPTPRGGHWLIDSPPGISTAFLDDGEQVRVLTLPLRGAGIGGPGRDIGETLPIGTLQVADSMAGVHAARARWEHETLALGLPLSGGAGLLVALAALVLLRPLRAVGEVATRVGDGDLAARIGPRAGRSRELARVGDVLDGMLERVQTTVARERRFVADASHELRTPLAVLRVAAERLAGRVGPERRGDVDDLIVRVDSLGRLVDDLLTLAVTDAGASAGAGALVRRPLRVGDIVADLERDLPLYGERRFVVLGCPGVVDADPDRLAQVVRNLVVNAVRHTDTDGWIEVRFSAAGARLRVEVQDDGTGIEPALLPHVFDRFRSEPARTSGRRGAAGLGLPICRALVEAHGGTITVASTLGEGTTVTFDLPGYRA